MKYKVGDKVRARKDLVVNKQYGTQVFVDSMMELRGKIVTIQCVINNSYYVEEDKNICPYRWTDEMLEPVITNWDKVKEEVKEVLKGMNVDTWDNDIFCDSIHTIKGEKDCADRDCDDCKEWLKQPYQESILDDVEKGYLRAVIKPWRDRVAYITLREYGESAECIRINVKDELAGMYFPHFKAGTMYKGMEIDKKYTLKDLDL
jgi:hypothetical protein